MKISASGKCSKASSGTRPYWPICLYGLCIIIVSSIPGDQFVAEAAAYDKIIHGIVFGGFSFLLIHTLYHAAGWRLLACVVGGIVFTSFFGVLDEFHQSFTPHRYPSALDVLADVVGASIAALIFLFFRWCCGLREKSH